MPTVSYPSPESEPATAEAPRTVDDIPLRVRHELTALLFQQAHVATLLATAFAMALAIYLSGHVSARALGLWVFLKLLVAAPRVVHALLFARRSRDDPRWLSSGRALMAIDGFVWGLAPLCLVPAQDTATLTAVLATLTGVCAVAAFVLHVDWWACNAYTAPILLASLLAPMGRGDTYGHYAALVILGFGLVLLLSTRRSEQQVRKMLTLRFQNEQLTAELSAALALANDKNRAQGEFVANMSHELRTPLHGILGVTNLLLAQPAGNLGSATDGLRIIRRCGTHLLDLINNVLEFARMGSQGVTLHPEPTELNGLIESTIDMCRPPASEKGLKLNCSLQLPKPLGCDIDAFRLRQILFNVVGNAIKFTDDGSVAISAKVSPPDHLLISIEDTGPGMSAQTVASIFRPFVQADGSSTRRHGGTGLGLSITRDLCRAMGGDISCHSTLGQGSRFDIHLPIVRCDEAPVSGLTTSPAPLDALEAEALGSPSPLHGRVLLAEDNEVNAMVAEAMLNHWGGLQVERVQDGHAVVDRACVSSERPDVVLLDCQMPLMDGFDAARRIREHEARHALPRLPLIALTANVFPHDRAQCLEAGMDDFLGKPFNQAQLQQVLTRYLGAPSPTEPPHAALA